MPRVTVVMPVFNGERFIAEAVESVLASSFTDFELLILDDGSTDQSLERARRAAREDSRVRVVSLPHRGVAAARNAGLAEARGELIANLDSDDAMLPLRLARQVAYLDRHPECVAVGSRAIVVDEGGRPTRVIGHFFTHEAIDRAHLDGRGGALGNESAMFRRQAARDSGGYEARLATTGEDHDFWLRLAEIGKLAALPDVLTRYRVHGGNVSLGEGSKERRLPVTLETLTRAFARRGIADRVPAKLPNAPLERWQRWCDRALLAHFAGRRGRAILGATIALILKPGSPVTRSAFRTVLGSG